MNTKKLLSSLGLTEGESNVYLALLSHGKSTVGPLTKESGVSPSKIYNVLDRLIHKGIVSYILEGKIKNYRVLSPKNFGEFIQRKRTTINTELDFQEHRLKKILPRLQEEYLSKVEEEYAEIYEGTRGIKAFYDVILEEASRGDEIKVVGYSRLASKLFHGYFVEYNKKCYKKGVKPRIIFEYDAWFGKKREKRPLAQYRYLPKGVHTPANICVSGDRVGTMIITEKQKLCFMIKNKEAAKSYDFYFKLMWDTAIKT